MEQEITKDVQEKLDKIDWKTLEQKYGISRKTVEQSPAIASQLVYGMHCWKGLHGRTETTTRGTATRMPTAAGRSVLR